jgi:hypothetical protein
VTKILFDEQKPAAALGVHRPISGMTVLDTRIYLREDIHFRPKAVFPLVRPGIDMPGG